MFIIFSLATGNLFHLISQKMQFKTISFMHMSHADFKGKGTKRSRHVLFFKFYSFCFFFFFGVYFYTRLFSFLYFCYLIVHYFSISLCKVSIKHIILNVQVLKAANSFKHPIQHMVACYEFFQASGLF